MLEHQDYMQSELDRDFLLYSERFMELMIDLQALLPTRRYLNVLIDDLHLIVKCQMSAFLEHGDGHLFSQVSDNYIINPLIILGPFALIYEMSYSCWID